MSVKYKTTKEHYWVFKMNFYCKVSFKELCGYLFFNIRMKQHQRRQCM